MKTIFCMKYLHSNTWFVMLNHLGGFMRKQFKEELGM